MAAAYAALVSLMNIIDALHRHCRPPISLDKTQVLLLTQKVNFLEKFLEGYDSHHTYNKEADPLEIRIADAAYAAEDAIESHILEQTKQSGGLKRIKEYIYNGIYSWGLNFVGNLRRPPHGPSSHALYEALEKVMEEMTLIEKEAIKIEETVGVQQHLLQRNSTLPSDSLRSSSILQKTIMVGADDILFRLKDKLTSDCRDLQIIPIVGMGGTGKTTLAINIYQDLFIKEHFDRRAWANVSQEYSIRELLIEVLRHLNQDIDQNLSEDELGEKLHKHLFGRRYLIIMDDMWNIDAWNGVKRFLPNNTNGSRIVITTRLLNLTCQLPSNSYTIEMKLLDNGVSWELLRQIVFGEKDCPLELENIGKKIGISCKGLALSIVVVGGLLAKSKHTREFWEYIEENINSIVNLENDEHCLKILHLSYKHLPIYLKSCYLYMGVFPEDKVVYVSELISLWIAEGFLKPIRGKSLEELAEEYLEDLIGRNLILVHEIGSTGDIEKFKIHDLLRDLCLREARKERFYIYDNPRGLVYGQRRVVISKPRGIAYAMSYMSPARPLIWNTNEALVLPRRGLRLLRILKLDNFLTIASKQKMHQLVNSRLLAFSTYEPTWLNIPCAIWLFWNLQTLITNAILIIVPTDFWYMTNIRHVEIGSLHLPDPPNGMPDDIVLGNLQTLGMVCNFKCGEQVVKRIPNIKKLRCEYVGLVDDMYCLNNLDRLDKLEDFACNLYKGDSLGCPDLSRLINFPYSLKKLHLQLEMGSYSNDMLDKIGELPLLQSLKLVNGGFKQGQWETTEGQFCSLRYLTLFRCRGLQVWTTESSHFPRLHHLKLHEVEELKEIPLEFAEISTLQLIDMILCSDSAIVSAKRILEEQEESFGEANLLVRVWDHSKELESLASANLRFVYNYDG